MSQYLKTLLRGLTKFFRKAPCITPASPSFSDAIRASERVTRYVFDKGHFRSSNNTARYSAFLPEKHSEQWETSVYRTHDLSDLDIWRIVDDHIAPKRKKPAKGRADVKAENVDACKGKRIAFVPETSEHIRHAIIVGWPDDKEGQIALALELANASSFFRR